MSRTKRQSKTKARGKVSKRTKPKASLAGRRANRPPTIAGGRVGQSVWMSPQLKRWVTAQAKRKKMSASAWIAARLEELRKAA